MIKSTTLGTPKWYVVNVFSGSEEKVIRTIREKAEKAGVLEDFLDLMAPKRETVEVKRGVKKQVSKTFFPGYILAHMVLRDETWHLVRSVPQVSGFLGGRERPTPLSKDEVNRIQGSVEEMREDLQHTHHFEVGECVQVIDGPFVSFSGVVEAVDVEKGRLKVSVTIFGRPTPVDLGFSQVEKTKGQ